MQQCPASPTLLCTFASATESLDGTFVFDDNFAIVKNPDVVKGFGWDVFVNDFWGMPIRNTLSNKSYRL